MADAMKPVWPAEREVGNAVYERVEKLVAANPSPGTSDWAELDYLSHLTESVEEVGEYDGPLTPLLASPPAREEAPAEGAGERRKLDRALSILEAVREMLRAENHHSRSIDKSLSEGLTHRDHTSSSRDDADLWLMNLYDRCGSVGEVTKAINALRNRTSEPEAGAVAWRWMWPETNQWHYADYDLHPEAEVNQPLYTHPAPATADKLKVAVDLLNDCIWLDTDTGDYRVEHDGSVEKARAILATLNEEGN